MRYISTRSWNLPMKFLKEKDAGSSSFYLKTGDANMIKSHRKAVKGKFVFGITLGKKDMSLYINPANRKLLKLFVL